MSREKLQFKRFGRYVPSIGWARSYQRAWLRGIVALLLCSALANPVTTFRAADLDGDSLQELITLEGEYSHSRSTFPGLMNVWEWNGFGFTIVFSQRGFYSDLAIAQAGSNQLLVLTP